MNGPAESTPREPSKKTSGPIAVRTFPFPFQGSSGVYGRKTTAEMVVVQTPEVPVVTQGAEAESMILPLMW
jgi:hypothetical protein